MKLVRAGTRFIGPGQPAFLVAEIGINHNGDLDLAKATIDAAAGAGADAVKLQNYRTEDFLADRSLTYSYVSQGQRIVESQYDMFKRCELTPQMLRELHAYCVARNLIMFSTPTSQAGVDELLALGTVLLKNGSDYLTHLPMVEAMGRSGVPTILSTGMATLAEIDDAVRAFRAAGGSELVLLHCTSSYPTPAADVHLRKIPVLGAAFDCPVGLSDHSTGIVAAVGAVALGACLIEKHFTLDTTLPGPDHAFSADPAEFRRLVEAVRTLEANLGEAAIGPTAAELESRCQYRLSCVAARALPEGHRLTAADVLFRRPGHGIPPKSAYLLTGRVLDRPVAAGHVLELGDLR